MPTQTSPSSIPQANRRNVPIMSASAPSESLLSTVREIQYQSNIQKQPGFVAPCSYLRPSGKDSVNTALKEVNSAMADQELNESDLEQLEALKNIRAFLRKTTSRDVLPMSYRLILFDSALTIKASLGVMVQNGTVSGPMWDSRSSSFVGLVTANDYINVIQYYLQNPQKVADIDKMRLRNLADIEKAIGVTPVETISVHPDRPLLGALRKMLKTRAKRIPLADFDDDTQRHMLVAVITQYRILKFITTNIKAVQDLRKPLKDLPNLGTYKNLQTVTMDTPVVDAIHLLVKHNISSVPIVDERNVVLNLFESVDVIGLAQGENDYEFLKYTVGQALLRRSEDSFQGIHACTVNDRLSAIFDTLRKARVHRFVIVEVIANEHFLRGVLTVSDIMKYILLEGWTEAEDLAAMQPVLTMPPIQPNLILGHHM